VGGGAGYRRPCHVFIGIYVREDIIS
jgi:hypothetical protein